VIGALTLVYLLGSVLHRALEKSRLEASDPYWRVLTNRAAWMPQP
jgi:hypothetical protein